jgi:hypothetical protein
MSGGDAKNTEICFPIRDSNLLPSAPQTSQSVTDTKCSQ